MAQNTHTPPLLELVAELRWDEPEALKPLPQQIGTSFHFNTQNSKIEQFYSNFTGEIYQRGFKGIDRISHATMPAFLYQPAMRFKTAESQNSRLFQIGAGMFSANAVQPYNSWSEFVQILRQGVEALLAAGGGNANDKRFSTLSLRYIDAFGQDYLGGGTSFDFVKNKLGFSIDIPLSIETVASDDEVNGLVIQFSKKLPNDMLMAVSVGEGSIVANGATADGPVVLMDTTISYTVGVAGNCDEIMEKFGAAQQVLHDIFHAQMRTAGINFGVD